MAIALVQTGSGESDGSNAVTLTFPGASTAGNLLVAFVAFGGNPTAVNTPVGWTKIHGTTLTISGLSGVWFSGFYKPNCGVQTTQVFDCTAGSVTAISVTGAEYSGLDTSSPLDQEAAATGTSGTLATGTINTLAASDLIIAGFGQHASGSLVDAAFSAPTSGFALEKQKVSVTLTTISGFSDKIVAATGAYSTGLTSSVSDDWCCLIAGFSAAAAPSAPPPRANFFFRPIHPAEILE